MTPAARQCIDLVLRHEGGYTINPNDPGNWSGNEVGSGVLRGTKFGIAAGSHPEIHDIHALTIEDAEQIYVNQYWSAMHGDSLPVALAMVTLDAGVMSGVSRGAKWLQAALGLVADGVIGPVTIEAANACPDIRDAVKSACSFRLAFLRKLPDWVTFGHGWGDRVIETQDAALSLCPLPSRI